MRLKSKAPVDAGAFAMFCIHYSGYTITHTPRESAGLTWGFAIWGLDRISTASTRARQKQIPFGDDNKKDKQRQPQAYLQLTQGSGRSPGRVSGAIELPTNRKFRVSCPLARKSSRSLSLSQNRIASAMS